MRRYGATQGFTLIELLVVVAIIALLISILLPSLQGAREQGKRAKCLANMKSVAQGSVAYSSEDRRELLTPMHLMAVSADHALGFTGAITGQDPAENYTAPIMSIRLGIPTSFGGRTPQVPIPLNNGGQLRVMMHPSDGGTERWLAKTRPLNKYVMGSAEEADNKSMEMYHCPADTGYPENKFMRDCPKSAVDTPTYDMLGNSYRINVAGYFMPSGPNGGTRGQFSIGVWGKPMSKLGDTGKVAMYCEPIFYNASRVLGEVQNAPEIVGWHKAIMKDNVAYCDGSARSTLAVQMVDWPAALLAQMNVATDNFWYYYLRRGDSWRTDTYPTPGSRIPMYRYNPDGTATSLWTGQFPQQANQATRWPYAGHNTIGPFSPQ